MSGDQFLIRPIRMNGPIRAGDVGQDAEGSGRGGRLAVVAGVLEQEPGEDLVAMQRRQGLVRAAQQTDEVSRSERRQRWDRAQVGVDLVDQVVGQGRQRDLQPADPPGCLQPARGRPRVEAGPDRAAAGRQAQKVQIGRDSTADRDDDR